MHKGPISGSVQPLAQINTKKGELDDGDDEMRSKMFVQSLKKTCLHYFFFRQQNSSSPLDLLEWEAKAGNWVSNISILRSQMHNRCWESDSPIRASQVILKTAAHCLKLVGLQT